MRVRFASLLGLGIAAMASTLFAARVASAAPSLETIGAHPESIAPAAAARLRAAGLDPASKLFLTQLAARLAVTRHRVVSVKRTVKANAPLRDRVRLTGSLGPLFTKAAPNSVAPSEAKRPIFRGVALNDPFLFAADGRFLGVGAPPIELPNVFVLQMDSTDQALPAATAAVHPTVTVAVPDCNVTASTDARFFRWDSDEGRTAAEDTKLNPTPGTYYATFWLLFGDVPSMPLGAKAHEATIALSYLDATLAPVPVTVKAWSFAQDFDLAVAEQAPFIAATNFGVTADNSSFGQAAVTRVNLTDSPMTGTDTFARGISLGAGYSAIATVVSASSVADVNGDTSPDNQYRGAVATSPQGGRLQTSVAWHIGPGESLQYVLRWTLTGPLGQRALSTLPLGGPCDS